MLHPDDPTCIVQYSIYIYIGTYLPGAACANIQNTNQTQTHHLPIDS